MTFTIPPANKVLGQTGFIADIDNAYAALAAVAGVNVLNTAYAGGADPTGTADSQPAFQAAVNAAVAAAPATVRIPAGPSGATYRLNSTVTCNVANVTIVADPGVIINYYGSGDCIRMYTTLSYVNGSGGGIIGNPTIDGTNASAGACGVHMGDMYRARVDFGCRNFQGTGSKGIWFDNQYWWHEIMTGQVWAQKCTSHVVFDNSANPGGNATGSFDRAMLDIFLDTQGKGDGVTWKNGAFCVNGRIGIYGNFTYGASLFYVLTLTGPASFSFTATNASPCVFTAAGWYFSDGMPVTLSGSPPTGFTAGTTYFTKNTNVGAGTFQLAATSGGTAINSTSTGSGTVQPISWSRISNSVLNIGVELNGVISGTQPGTINFGNSGILTNCIQNCTGIIDLSGSLPFAVNATNWTSNFQFAGPVSGDANLKSNSTIGQAAYVHGAITNGSTINTRYNAVASVAPAGNVTGIIMLRDFSTSWREVTVINESAFTVTFAASGTSFVADGTSDVIAANTAAKYAWDPNTGLWYRM